MRLHLPKWLPGNRKPRQRILDACCGSRMFWTHRDHPDVLYMDYDRLLIAAEKVRREARRKTMKEAR